MYKLQCAEIWGGIEEGDVTIASPGITASLFSSSGQGTRGGDIYYLSLCNSAYITRIAIADVAGHGDFVSAISQSLYDSFGRHVDNLNGNEVLADVNRDAFARGVAAMTTAIVVTYYHYDKTFSYVYAGHPPVLLKRHNDNGWNQLHVAAESKSGVSNIPLAVDETAEYIQSSVKLDSGDRILLYTDGLLETPSVNGEPFGMSRLLETLKNHDTKDLEELRREIIQALCNHASDRLVHDDVTLLLLQIG